MPSTLRRKLVFDCSHSPDCGTCRLVFSGDEPRVMSMALSHAMRKHRLRDTPELRMHLRAQLREEVHA